MLGSCREHSYAVVVYEGYRCPICKLLDELDSTKADLEEEMKTNAELLKRIRDGK